MGTPQSIGRYRVVRELGRGGMGAVYEVQQEGLDRRLALKVILADVADAEALARFGREAQLLARFKHPNVVEVHELGRTEQGSPFLVTALVEGEELKAKLDREGAMEPETAAVLVRALAGALAAVHAKGVLHRDLKPHNIIVRPDGSPVLLDFGVATGAGVDRLTQTGAIVGTPAYMSPEQAEGSKDLDERADVYALGATLYHLLCGHAPFHETSGVMQVVHKIMTKDPRWPSKDRRVPEGLEAILRQAMAKDPTQRYPSAFTLEEDLGRFLGGEEVLAKVPRSLSRALVASLVALVLALGWAAYSATKPAADDVDPEVAEREARQRKREADRARAEVRRLKDDRYAFARGLERWMRDYPDQVTARDRKDHEDVLLDFPMPLAVLEQPPVAMRTRHPNPNRSAVFVGGARLVTCRYGSPLQAWDVSDPARPKRIPLPPPPPPFDPLEHGVRRVAGDPASGRFWAAWIGSHDGQRGVIAYDLDAGTAQPVDLAVRDEFPIDAGLMVYSSELDVLVLSTRQIDMSQSPPAEFSYPWRVHLELFRPSGEWVDATTAHPLGIRWIDLQGRWLLAGYGLGTDVRERLPDSEAVELHEIAADGRSVERRARILLPFYLPAAGAVLPDGSLIVGTNGHRLFHLEPRSQTVDLKKAFGRRGRLLGARGDARRGEGEVAHNGAVLGVVHYANGTRLITSSAADAPALEGGAGKDPGKAGLEALKESRRDPKKSELRIWRKEGDGWVEDDYGDDRLADAHSVCRLQLVASPDRQLMVCLTEARTKPDDVERPLSFELWALEPPE